MAEYRENRHKIEQVDLDGITLAYALDWSEYFHEWSFYRLPNPTNDAAGQRMRSGLGVCIGGVRVEATSPGFKNYSIAAIANATGPKAPRTNVARSGLEATEQWERAVEAFYKSFFSHVTSEVSRMQNENRHSLTWAAQEAPYIMQPLNDSNAATYPNILSAEVAKVPALLVEVNGARVAMSPEQLSREETFWTIDCEFFSHAERLIREVRANASLSALIATLGAGELNLPKDPVLCSTSPSNPLVRKLMEEREVDYIRVLQEQRRVDLRWGLLNKTTPKWRSVTRDTISNQARMVAFHSTQAIMVELEGGANPGGDPGESGGGKCGRWRRLSFRHR